MAMYLGHQPILDKKLNTAGYELLFGSLLNPTDSSTTSFDSTVPKVVNDMMATGFNKVFGVKSAWIRLNRSLLLEDWSGLLPAGRAVMEIADGVPADDEVLTACSRFREQGHLLALQSGVDDARADAFAPLVDLMKVDVKQTSASEQDRIIQKSKKLRIALLAGIIETEHDLAAASRLGYDYFQGRFFGSAAVQQTNRVRYYLDPGFKVVVPYTQAGLPGNKHAVVSGPAQSYQENRIRD